MYRRRTIKDFKDLLVDDVTVDGIFEFIIKSTFIGSGPEIIRELSNENAMKIFSYNRPVMIMFRNTSASDVRYYTEQLAQAFPQIEEKILVCLADINTGIGQKIAQLVGLDTEVDHFPNIRILDPNPGKSFVIKYSYNKD